MDIKHQEVNTHTLTLKLDDQELDDLYAVSAVATGERKLTELTPEERHFATKLSEYILRIKN